VKTADLAKGPYWNTCGMSLGDKDGADVTLESKPEILQDYGTIHGGLLMGMLDKVITAALNRELPPGKGAVTVEMKINFFKPVQEFHVWERQDSEPWPVSCSRFGRALGRQG
jgi:acyl-coenzyme A thioesterase PaaI-like protein